MSSDLLSQLTQLEAGGLVRLALSTPDLEYAFKHALVQDAAYSTLVRQQRQDIHRQAAHALEALFPDRVDELSALLAHHWEAAGDTERARHYLYRAGCEASCRYANAEALELFGRALALAEEAPAAELAALHEGRAQVHEFLSQNADALHDLEIALAHCRQDRPHDECRVLARMAWLHWLSGHGAQALDVARDADALARQVGDPSLAMRATMVVGLVDQAEGRLVNAHSRLRAALFASRARDDRVGEAESLFYLGIQNNFMGRFGRGAACATKALALKQQLKDRVGEVLSNFLLARAEAGRGHYDDALRALEAGREGAAAIHNPFGLAQYPNTRAWIASELGDWASAYRLDQSGLEATRGGGMLAPRISALLNLALECVHLNRLDEADGYVTEIQGWMGRPEFGFHSWRWQIRLADVRVRLAMGRSQPDPAQAALAELTDWATRTQSHKYLARARLLGGSLRLAGLASRTGQASSASTEAEWADARADLLAARELADRMQNPPLQVQTRRALIEWHDRRGETRAVADLGDEVLRLLEALERRLVDPELRASFERGLGRRLRVADAQADASSASP